MNKTLAAVLLLGAVLRLALLGSNPAGVFHDEAEKGYSAWSLARMGRVIDFTAPIPHEPGDEAYATTRWPVFINVWGSHTSAIYQYAALPLMKVFGPNNWTLRLPAALAGTLTLLFCFLLVRELYDEKIALVATLLLAFSPWHLVFSRWAAQGIFVPLFVCAGLWLLARVAQEERKNAGECGADSDLLRDDRQADFLSYDGAGWKPALQWLGAAVCLGLAFYAYAGARPFLLVFFCWIAWLWRREILAQKKWSVPAVALLALITGLTLYAMLSGGAERMERFNRLSVFNHPGGVGLFLRNYLEHYSPLFLFFTGDAQPRHDLPWCGVMLHLELPLLLAGLWTLAKRLANADLLLLGWFAMFPVSAALTNEGIPHALRTLHAVPCTMAISAIGLFALRDWIKSEQAMRGYWLALCGNGVVVAGILILAFPLYSAYSFETGLRKAIAVAEKEASIKRDEVQCRILNPLHGGYPPVRELFYFAGRVEPEDALRNGDEASRFVFLLEPDFIEQWGKDMRSGDNLILYSPGIAEGASRMAFKEIGKQARLNHLLAARVVVVEPVDISGISSMPRVELICLKDEASFPHAD